MGCRARSSRQANETEIVGDIQCSPLRRTSDRGNDWARILTIPVGSRANRSYCGPEVPVEGVSYGSDPAIASSPRTPFLAPNWHLFGPTYRPQAWSFPIDTLYVDRYYSYREPIGGID